MPRTPDRAPGASDEEGIVLESTSPSTQEGEMRYNAGGFTFYDSLGEFDPRTGGGGISAAQHKALRDLVHFVDGPADGFTSGTYFEQLPSGDPFPTSGIWYTDNTKTDKTYNANKTVATEVWKMYDTDGSTVLVTLTDTYSYSGIVVSTVDRTWA